MYEISFSFKHVTCTPPHFSKDLAFFRELFLWRLGGGGGIGRLPRPPPWLRQDVNVLSSCFKNKHGMLC
jgi:hypothetical protein